MLTILRKKFSALFCEKYTDLDPYLFSFVSGGKGDAKFLLKCLALCPICLTSFVAHKARSSKRIHPLWCKSSCDGLGQPCWWMLLHEPYRYSTCKNRGGGGGYKISLKIGRQGFVGRYWQGLTHILYRLYRYGRAVYLICTHSLAHQVAISWALSVAFA